MEMDDELIGALNSISAGEVESVLSFLRPNVQHESDENGNGNGNENDASTIVANARRRQKQMLNKQTDERDLELHEDYQLKNELEGNLYELYGTSDAATRSPHASINELPGSDGDQIPNDNFRVLRAREFENDMQSEVGKWIQVSRARRLEPWERIAYNDAVRDLQMAAERTSMVVAGQEILEEMEGDRLVERQLFGDNESPDKPTGLKGFIGERFKEAAVPDRYAKVIKGAGDRSNEVKQADPTWEFVDTVLKKDDDEFWRLWDDKRFKDIWEVIGGSSFTSRQEFMQSIREVGNKDGLLKRLEPLFPGFQKQTMSLIVDRVLSMLQSSTSKKNNNLIDPIAMANQSIADNVVERDRNPFWSYANIASKPRPTMSTIIESVRAIANNKVREEQMRMVTENMLVNDPRKTSNPIGTLFDNLKPVHSAAEVGAVPKSNRTIYTPKVIHGVATAVGRRKTSVARVKITPGSGSIIVNGRNYLDYFGANRYALVKLAIPLKMVGCMQQFDVNVKVKGGGVTGQSEAIMHGLSRALAKFQPEFGYYLTKFSMMRRDPRMVERKKPGREKARKKFQWVKR